MFSLTFFDKSKDSVTIEIESTNSYTGIPFKERRIFANEDLAQSYYWSTVDAYLNFAIGKFVNNCRLISANYFNYKSVPYVNNNDWRTNYWKLLTFSDEYFFNVNHTMLFKAKLIKENEEVIRKTVTPHNELGFKHAKEQYQDIIKLANEIISYCGRKGLDTLDEQQTA